MIKYRFIYKGEELTAKELAPYFGLRHKILLQRLRQGWVYKHEMLTKPKRQQEAMLGNVVSMRGLDVNLGFSWDCPYISSYC